MAQLCQHAIPLRSGGLWVWLPRERSCQCSSLAWSCCRRGRRELRCGCFLPKDLPPRLVFPECCCLDISVRSCRCLEGRPRAESRILFHQPLSSFYFCAHWALKPWERAMVVSALALQPSVASFLVPLSAVRANVYWCSLYVWSY